MSERLDGPLVHQVFSEVCSRCRHLTSPVEPRTCTAFPGGIPGEIWDGEHDHRTPFPGDHGIRFEPVEVPR